MWLQELLSFDDIQKLLTFDDIDDLGSGVYVGAIKHPHAFRRSHTIVLWWTKGKKPAATTDILQKITFLDRPSSSKRGVVFTTNGDHVLSNDSPLNVYERSTEEVIGYIHLIREVNENQCTWKEYLKLLMNLRNIYEDAMNPNAPRYINSLKKAKIYRDYYEVNA